MMESTSCTLQKRFKSEKMQAIHETAKINPLDCFRYRPTKSKKSIVWILLKFTNKKLRKISVIMLLFSR